MYTSQRSIAESVLGHERFAYASGATGYGPPIPQSDVTDLISDLDSKLDDGTSGDSGKYLRWSGSNTQEWVTIATGSGQQGDQGHPGPTGSTGMNPRSIWFRRERHLVDAQPFLSATHLAPRAAASYDVLFRVHGRFQGRMIRLPTTTGPYPPPLYAFVSEFAWEK